MSEYKCLRCDFRFYSKNEIPYCPACDCENIRNITLDDNKYIEKENEVLLIKQINKEVENDK